MIFKTYPYGLYVRVYFGRERRNQLSLKQIDDVYSARKYLKKIEVHYQNHFSGTTKGFDHLGLFERDMGKERLRTIDHIRMVWRRKTGLARTIRRVKETWGYRV